MTDHYLSDETYNALLAALAAAKPDPASGKIEPHCFVEALGETGGIWPASVLMDQAHRAPERGPADRKMC